MWNGSENQIKLVLIRHGATRSNKELRYLGKTDESLNEEGRIGLMDRKMANQYPEVKYVFTSPMKRCLETAEIIYSGRNKFVITEWEEMDFGNFEGKNYKELQDDMQYQAWIDSNGTLPFPNGESREEFVMRCKVGFRKMIKELLTLAEINSDKEMTVGMIVHGGTIMSLLSSYYGGDYFDYQVTNGAGYIAALKDLENEPQIVEVKKI